MSSDNTIKVFKNKDKEGWQETWTVDRNWMNLPHPFRCLLSATPGSGKTNIIKNIILKADPIFKRIVLLHYDIGSEEYEDLHAIRLSEIPEPLNNKLFDKKLKTLLIIDDYDFTAIKNNDKAKLDRLFGYTSTHGGLSILCATQDFFNLPVRIRRMSDVYCVWKNSADVNTLYMIGSKMGLTKKEFERVMDHCKKKFDFVVFDFKDKAPAKIRLNFYAPILIKGGDETVSEK